MYLPYAGVGSRETPPFIGAWMKKIAHRLEDRGFTLRSGHASGADTFFESGVSDPRMKEIFLAADDDKLDWNIRERARDIAASIHPAWNAPNMLSYNAYGQRAHTRNVFQVLGGDLESPAKFLVCWTPRGLETGGTRTAIILAKQNSIPVVNFGDVELVYDFNENHKRMMDKMQEIAVLVDQLQSPAEEKKIRVYHCMRDPYPKYDVYVGRRHPHISSSIPGSDGRWGNPFAVSDALPRGQAVKKYYEWVITQPELIQNMRTELKGKSLACWCVGAGGMDCENVDLSNGLICHSQVIAMLANSDAGGMLT